MDERKEEAMIPKPKSPFNYDKEPSIRALGFRFREHIQKNGIEPMPRYSQETWNKMLSDYIKYLVKHGYEKDAESAKTFLCLPKDWKPPRR